MKKVYSYDYLGASYTVEVTYKRSRTISYRYRDKRFIVYAPYLTSYKTISKGLDKFAKQLIDDNAHLQGENDEYIYLLGNKYPKSSGVIYFSDDSKITFKNDEELHKKIKKWFLLFITKRVRYYEKMMNTYENKVGVRVMSTRYGSNTPSHHSLRFSYVLVHFTVDVIDAIIVHELAHCFVHGHSKEFYNLVYKYCPNYDYLHKRLRKGIFNDSNN